MDKLSWLATAVAAVSVGIANAQLAQVDNDTMPTSMFMTRPQSLAPVLNITHSGDFSQGYIFIGPYQHPGAGPYIFGKFGNLVWDGFGITGSTNAHDFKVCQYRGEPHLCFSQMNQRNGYGVGQGLIIDHSYRIVASVQTGRDAMPADMHEMNVIDDEEQSCCKTRLERKQDIECKVIKPFKEFKTALGTLSANLKRNYENAILFHFHGHEKGWLNEAKALHERWIKYKYPRYSAFCRHDGEWKDASKKTIRWNEQIVEIFADGMQNAFAQIKVAFLDIQRQFIFDVNGLLYTLDTDLRESPELMGLNLDSLHKVIDLTRSAVEDKTTKLFRELDNGINTYRYFATSIEPENSYVVNFMQLAYNDCKLRKGTGVFNQIKQIIGQQLTGPTNVFVDAKDQVITDFEDHVDRWIQVVENKVGAEFQAIIDDFNGRFVDVEEEDEIKHGFRKELLHAVQKAMGIMDTELKAELDACAQFR